MRYFFFIYSFLLSGQIFAQHGYPVPQKTANHLFYIQHSENKNTFVYDAIFANQGILNDSDPVDIYRILYAEEGQKKPLTLTQQKFAYGLKISKIDKNIFQLHLVSYPAQKLTLKLNSNKNPIVQTKLNNKTITLNRVFLKQKDGTSGLSTKIEYMIFYGKDSNGKSVQEKLVL